MRIAVTGKAGQVATAMAERAERAGVEVVTVGRPELDLACPGDVTAVFAALAPDAIVSAAAHTGVDKAESEPDLAQAINATGAAAVAKAAAELGVPIVHLSTDYVFDGSKTSAWVETDPVAPLGVYGASKLAGETAVLGSGARAVVLRLAWVYSPFGANFVKTMLRLAESRDRLAVVADQIGAPTSALDIADGVFAVVRTLLARPGDRALEGVFHMGAGGPDASWADFAEAVFDGAAARGGKRPAVDRIPTSAYPTPARRPARSRLASAKLAEIHGVELPDWRLSLDTVLDRLIGPRSTDRKEPRS
ncbi:MAG: dTDP-4-dehydrorhamnose reductase [Phyllobacteriaceae bacterium]|nr:dTDP-4-dehydrorhamnose reductase [Phyllobacteriaceae bacterium]